MYTFPKFAYEGKKAAKGSTRNQMCYEAKDARGVNRHPNERDMNARCINYTTNDSNTL